MIVKHEDLYCLPGGKKLCSRGARQWFNDHGLDYSGFLANGIEADLLLATEDPRAALMVDKAEQRLRAE